MGIQHLYEQSSAAWHREWSSDEGDDAPMTDEEESAFSMEMDAVNAEAAEYRKQERENVNLSPLPEIELDLDAAF